MTPCFLPLLDDERANCPTLTIPFDPTYSTVLFCFVFFFFVLLGRKISLSKNQLGCPTCQCRKASKNSVSTVDKGMCSHIKNSIKMSNFEGGKSLETANIIWWDQFTCETLRPSTVGERLTYHGYRHLGPTWGFSSHGVVGDRQHETRGANRIPPDYPGPTCIQIGPVRNQFYFKHLGSN